MTFERVAARAVATGIVLASGPTSALVDFVDPASGAPYSVEVGVPGSHGPTLEVNAGSLTAHFEHVGAGAHPAARTLRLARSSADPDNPAFNLYRAVEGLVPVMDGIPEPAAGLPLRVMPLGRLRLDTQGDALVLPVGVGADRVEWLTQDARPSYGAGLLDHLLSFFSGPLLPSTWVVTQSARFMRGATSLPGLRVSAFLDRRTSNIDDRSGIVAMQRETSGEYTAAAFPQMTDDSGRIYFRVHARATDEAGGQELAGVVLALDDVVGMRALSLLGVGGGAFTLPAATDVLSQHETPPRVTSIVAGYATVGGIPRRHSAWYRAAARLVVDQVVGNDPDLLAIKEQLAAGLMAGGIVFTSQQLDDYYTYFMLGAMMGVPRGAVAGFTDSVVGVFEMVGSTGAVLKLMSPTSGPDALRKLFVLNYLAQPGPGGVLSIGSLAGPYLQQHRDDMRRLLPILRAAARFVGREEIQVQLTSVALRQLMANYDLEMGHALGLLGVPNGTVAFRGMTFGYSVGALGGYLAELALETLGASLVGEAVGACLPLMLKATRLGAAGSRVASALGRVARLGAAGNDASRFVRGFRILIRFLDALGPNVLERWILRIAEVPDGPERMFALMVRFSDHGDAVVVAERVAKGLGGDAASSTGEVVNVVETLVTLSKVVADEQYRAGQPLVLLVADNAEDFGRALGALVDALKASPELEDGAENILRTLEHLDRFLSAFGRAGRADREIMTRGLTGAARLAACP